MKIYQNITINPLYDDQVERQIREGESDPRGSVEIKVGETYLTGGPDKSYLGHYFSSLFFGLIEGIESIITNEKYVMMTYDGPTYLVIERIEYDIVQIVHCFTSESAENPDERIPEEIEVAIKKDVLMNEIIRTAKEFTNRVVNLNSELKDHPEIQELQDRIQEVQQKY